MKKILFAICICMLAAAASRADVVSLDIPADGNYGTAAVPFPTISTSQSIGGATFDIVYTLSAVSNDTGAVVGVINSQIGVGSDNDINPNHFNTLEGDGSAGDNGSTAGGEGLSFTGLAITNFQANGSGLTQADFTDLQFESLSVTAVNNRFDGADISFDAFGGTTANVGLGNVGTPDFTIDLTELGNFSTTATDLFVVPDSNGGSNRFAVTGLEVSFTNPVAVPEPSTLGLLGLGMIGLVSRRRRS